MQLNSVGRAVPARRSAVYSQSIPAGGTSSPFSMWLSFIVHWLIGRSGAVVIAENGVSSDSAPRPTQQTISDYMGPAKERFRYLFIK